jgi:hypothetical protein
VLGLKLDAGRKPGNALPLDNKPAFVCLFDRELELRLVFDGLFGLGPHKRLARLFERELDVAVFGVVAITLAAMTSPTLVRLIPRARS